MKRLFLIIPLILIIFVGCADNSDLTSPNFQSSERAWLPINSNSLEKFSDATVEKEIDGSKGGFIAFKRGILHIPKDAFEGSEVITVTNNNQLAVVDFGPSMKFKKDVECSIIYKNLDLTGFDPSQIEFGYMDGTNFIRTDYNRLVVNVKKGTLAVFGAKFDHFSRYGFTW